MATHLEHHGTETTKILLNSSQNTFSTILSSLVSGNYMYIIKKIQEIFKSQSICSYTVMIEIRVLETNLIQRIQYTGLFKDA